jgi:hypothetical protein
MRALLTGWFSFTDGEKTAGDVLALEAVGAALRSAAIAYDTAWSPMFRPGGFGWKMPGRSATPTSSSSAGQSAASRWPPCTPDLPRAGGVSVISPRRPGGHWI